MIKEELKQDWKDMVAKNQDSYGGSVVNTARYIMEELDKGLSPQEAHDKGFEKYDMHSGMSASYVATTVYKYSPRGEEWKTWAKEGDKFMVDWK